MANFWWGGGAVEWPLWKVNKGCPSSSQPWNMVLTAEHSWAHQPFWWCLWETYLRTKNTDEEQTGREWGEDRKGGGGGNNTVRAIGDALLCLGRYRPKGSTAHGEPTWDLRKRVRNMELQKLLCTSVILLHHPLPLWRNWVQPATREGERCLEWSRLERGRRRIWSEDEPGKEEGKYFPEVFKCFSFFFVSQYSNG